METKECPDCNINLVAFPTVNFRGDSGSMEQIGQHFYCENMNCHHEEDNPIGRRL